MEMSKTMLFYTVVLYTLFIHQSTASARDEIPDFEFDDHAPAGRPLQRESTSFTFDDFDDFFLDDGNEPEYDIATKEKTLHRALFKALAAKDLKYKFSEVLPLLRALSKSQRTVFASIISAQINGGKSLTLEEVRKLFVRCNLIRLLVN
jgi:DNA polymerase III epsilon subunit-like protein